jgi:septum formation protein
MNNKKLVLASASPRRQELLEMLGIDLIIEPSGIDESYRPGESPRDHALRLSLEKARDVAEKYPGLWVLGADTIVVVDSEVLGKPEGREDARQMLLKLSGREHLVITAFALVLRQTGVEYSRAVESRVTFNALTEDELRWYLETGEPYDKAGAYAVQGKAAAFIKELRGSHTNVIGLPLSEVVEALRKTGAMKLC